MPSNGCPHLVQMALGKPKDCRLTMSTAGAPRFVLATDHKTYRQRQGSSSVIFPHFSWTLPNLLGCTCSWFLLQIAIWFLSWSPRSLCCFTQGVLNKHGERNGNRDDLFPRPKKFPPKSSCKSDFCHHLHLTPVLFISTKGNLCSRNTRCMDLGLSKPYGTVLRLPS